MRDSMADDSTIQRTVLVSEDTDERIDAPDVEHSEETIAETRIGRLTDKIRERRRRLVARWQAIPSRQQDYYVWLVGFALAATYLKFIETFMPLRPDHAFVTFCIIAMFFGKAREFVKYWGPFIGLWVCYDMLRGVADDVAPRVHVRELYDWELAATGWFTDGNIIPFYFQEMKSIHGGEWYIDVLTAIASIFYGQHFTGPLLIAWLLYWKVDDKTEYKRFVSTLILTSYAGFITFLIFPSAPPWYVWNKGNGLRFSSPEPGGGVDAAGLLDFDEMTGLPIFRTVYDALNSNAYAAVPSLHGAYSLIVYIFFVRKYGKVGHIAIVFPIGMWFGAAWLNHHYLIDLLWGAAYVMVFYPISLKIFKPPKDVEDKTETDDDADERPAKAGEDEEGVGDVEPSELPHDEEITRLN